MTEKRLLPTVSPVDGARHGAHPSRTLARRRAWVVLALSVLILVALLLRLHTVWQRHHESPDELAVRLVGGETHYEGLAYALLQGTFFQWPGRVPVYPLFIAATYYALGERSAATLLYVAADTTPGASDDWLARWRAVRLGKRAPSPESLPTLSTPRDLASRPAPEEWKGCVLLPRRGVVERTLAWLHPARRLRKD